MIIDSILVIEGLDLVNEEKIVQGKIISLIDKKLYDDAKVLKEYYDKLCSKTDDVARKIIEQIGDENLGDVQDVIEDIACEKYGGNCSEGLSLTLIIGNIYFQDKFDDGVIPSDTIKEESYYDVHNLLCRVYLNSEDEIYKNEMLDFINNNISRSVSLRALYRGNDKKLYDYDPDEIMDKDAIREVGEVEMRAQYFIVCVCLDELNRGGLAELKELGFNEEDAKKIFKAQKDYQKINLASFYKQAVRRGFDIRIDINEFRSDTQKDIEDGFTIGDASLKEDIKEKMDKIKVLLR